MSSWSCDQKVCASCRYWLGKRDVDFLAYFFESISGQGKCAAPKGVFRGVDMGEGSTCSDWGSFKNHE